MMMEMNKFHIRAIKEKASFFVERDLSFFKRKVLSEIGGSDVFYFWERGEDICGFVFQMPDVGTEPGFNLCIFWASDEVELLDVLRKGTFHAEDIVKESGYIFLDDIVDIDLRVGRKYSGWYHFATRRVRVKDLVKGGKVGGIDLARDEVHAVVLQAVNDLNNFAIPFFERRNEFIGCSYSCVAKKLRAK